MTKTNFPTMITSTQIQNANWTGAVNALRLGHQLPKAAIKDMQLETIKGDSLNRAASIKGLGIGVKSVTIFPGNATLSPPVPSVQGAYLLFDAEHGGLRAVMDGILVTYWKTAADSMLGCQLLANPDAREVLIVGSGTVARSLVSAYREIFPSLSRIRIWSRNISNAEAAVAWAEQMAVSNDVPVEVAETLPKAVAESDIISTATLSREPVLRDEWITPGTHIDLIGAYNAHMREADDALIRDHKLCVDSRETTVHEIGELMIPIASGVITADSVRADLYDLVAGQVVRESRDDITVYKNGGGAHLDLMIANYLQESVS